MILISIFLLIMILNSKSKQIKSLEERIRNQELFIGELYNTKEYKHVEELQLEIMDLGAQLDSMKIKYD